MNRKMKSEWNGVAYYIYVGLLFNSTNVRSILFEATFIILFYLPNQWWICKKNCVGVRLMLKYGCISM